MQARRTVRWMSWIGAAFITVIVCACARPSAISSTAPVLTATPPTASHLPAQTGPTPTARVLQYGDANSTGTGATPSSNLPPEHADDTTPAAPPNPDEAIKALPQVGSYAPDFTLRALDGVTVTLSQLRGRAVLVNFWTSWCVACSAEAAQLQALYETYKGHNFIVLGVNITPQDTVADAREYVKTHHLTFPIPMDEQAAIANAYHVPGLPASFFIDAQGIIRNVMLGQMRPADMQQGLQQLGIQ